MDNLCFKVLIVVYRFLLGCWKLEAYYKSELLVPPAVDSNSSTDPAPRVQWNDPTRSPLDTEDAVNYELSLTPSR